MIIIITNIDVIPCVTRAWLVGGGTRLLLLSNLPAEITTDDIEKYFYTRVPEVDAVLVKNRREGIATVEVNGLRG